MIFVAHRGFRVDVIENTMHAFNRSVQMQMDFIELDVQLSQDGDLFVHHDSKLGRVMKGWGKFSNKSTKKLKKIRSKQLNQSIPTLEEVFEDIVQPQQKSDHPIKLMIELKGENTARPTCEIVSKMQMQEYVVFSGRNISELGIAHSILNDIPLCLNITSCKEFSVSKLLQTNTREQLPLPFHMISLAASRVEDSAFIEKCHELGIQAITWNFINEKEPIPLMENIIDLGIDGILFDDPNTVSPIREYRSKK